MTITHTSRFATPNPYATLPTDEAPRARKRATRAACKQPVARTADRMPVAAAASGDNSAGLSNKNAVSHAPTLARGAAAFSAAALAAGGMMALRAPQPAAAMQLPTNWRIFSSFSANRTRYDLNYYDDNYGAAKDADSDIRACGAIVEPAFAAETLVYFGTKNNANAMLWGSAVVPEDPFQRCITAGWTQGSDNGAAAIAPSHTALIIGFGLLTWLGFGR